MTENVAENLDSTDRAKHLTRKQNGGLLDKALEQTGFTKTDVAEYWGCTRPIVSQVCLGNRPLTDQRMWALPEVVRDAYMRLLGRELMRAWLPLPEPEGKPAASHSFLADMAREDGETMAVFLRAMADGYVTQGENAAMQRELWEDIELRLGRLLWLQSVADEAAVGVSE